MKKPFFSALAFLVLTSVVSAQVVDKIEEDLGFQPLFNGKNFDGWQGDTANCEVSDGVFVFTKKGGNVVTAEKFANFIFRFEYKIEANGNNGMTFRALDLSKELSFVGGTEIQILDDSGSDYTELAPYQYHGSIYGVVPAKRGGLKPVGEWNAMEVMCDGTRVKVTVNGMVKVDAKLDEVIKSEFIDKRDHPALMNNDGYFGFLGHNCRLEFRNLRALRLTQFGQGEKILEQEKELRK